MQERSGPPTCRSERICKSRQIALAGQRTNWAGCLPDLSNSAGVWHPGRYTRFVNYEEKIAEVRARLTMLDAMLDEKRTPYLKSQIRLAGYSLDDAEAAVRHAETASDPANWNVFTDLSIQQASQRAETIQKMIDTYGPKLMEM